MKAWATVRSAASTSAATTFHTTTPPACRVRSFEADKTLGESVERLYMRRKQLLNELWMKNPAQAIQGMREYDVMRVTPSPHLTVEIKCDLRARDRLFLESAAIEHSSSDMLAYWVEPLQQFYEIPMVVAKYLNDKVKRYVSEGKPLPRNWYYGEGGDYRADGTRGKGTAVPIAAFIRLPNCQPA